MCDSFSFWGSISSMFSAAFGSLKDLFTGCKAKKQKTIIKGGDVEGKVGGDYVLGDKTTVGKNAVIDKGLSEKGSVLRKGGDVNGEVAGDYVIGDKTTVSGDLYYKPTIKNEVESETDQVKKKP